MDQRSTLETSHGRTRDSDILLHAATARSDSPDHDPIDFDGNSTAKDYDSGIIGRVEPKAIKSRGSVLLHCTMVLVRTDNYSGPGRRCRSGVKEPGEPSTMWDAVQTSLVPPWY
jgi:hypothetical protein